jgi:predicted RNA-binding protein with PUA-like domain
MRRWLLKTEPEECSWDDIVKKGRMVWNGVRNPVAARNLRAMAAGDLCLIYHTGKTREVVGIAKVVRTAYPDPKDSAWVNVDVAPVRALKRPFTLDEMKKDPSLKGLVILRQPRLSVAPVSVGEWKVLAG